MLVGVEVDEDAVVGEEVSVLAAVVVGAEVEVVGDEVSVSVAVIVEADVEVVGEAVLVSVELEQSTP